MPQHDDIATTDTSEIEALMARLEAGQLREGDTQTLHRLLRTFLSLIHLLQCKNSSIARLKRLLFGSRSDKRTDAATAVVTKPELASAEEPTTHEGETRVEQTPASDITPLPTTSSTSKLKRAGHGRLPAAAYTGARVEQCIDPKLKAGDTCPDAVCTGRLYDTKTPAVLIRLTGQPIVGATRYEQEVLRCSSCQTRFTAPLPSGVPPEKYDATADVAIALAKYQAGLPFHRLARVQDSFGVPLPESVQFARCEAVADAALPVFLHLRKLAAQAELLHADDTRVRILECLKENKQLAQGERRGLHTTGIVARVDGRQIVLYQSGRHHAGENIDELLRHRAAHLPPPKQMGDALSSNWSREFETIICKCLAHARRQFVEIEAAFPAECGRVLNDLAAVYGFDSQTREMCDEERLLYHQQHSGPVLAALRSWITEQMDERRVEPNSSLGRAFAYILKHWEGLTRVLDMAGAPLDNNVVERALKLVVLHRKNALFFRTEHGAAIGDLIFSLIETCHLNGVSVWDYLVCLVRHARTVRRDPSRWLPWNYMPEEVKRCAA